MEITNNADKFMGMVAMGYVVTIRRDDNNHELVYVSTSMGDEGATFHATYDKAIGWLWDWCNRDSNMESRPCDG